MAAAAYAFSGYFASQLNLYNTVAAAALAPALVAALLETAPAKSPSVRRRGLLFSGLVPRDLPDIQTRRVGQLGLRETEPGSLRADHLG